MRENKERSAEDVHPLGVGLGTLPIDEVLRRICEDNAGALDLTRGAVPRIAAVVRAYTIAYKEGERIFYVGAGTSGRLGFVDAAELPATFGIAPDRVQVIFPGDIADASAEIDSCEDDASAGQCAVMERDIESKDLIIGITASREPLFVIGAVQEAKSRGASTAGITNNVGTTLERLVDLPIVIPTGPELIAGSTRLKAETVQKIVLNMLSTAAMISLGKVYDGFMIGLRANNEKLRRRAIRILTALTGHKTEAIEQAPIAADYEVDTALIVLTGSVTYKASRECPKNIGSTGEDGISGRE